MSTSLPFTLRVRSEDGLVDVPIDPPVDDPHLLGLVGDLREGASDVWVLQGPAVRLAHHRDPAGFCEDLGRPDALTLDALEILLIEQPGVAFQLDEAGLTVWAEPLASPGLQGFYRAIEGRLRADRAGPPGVAGPGEAFPVGPYRSGVWLADVRRAADGIVVVPVGHEPLTAFLADLTPDELVRVVAGFVEGRSVALDARGLRDRWLLEVTGEPVRYRLWTDGIGAAREVRADLLALCLELQTRGLLLPTDGEDASHWSVPEWVTPLRAMHVQLLVGLRGAGVEPFRPSEDVAGG